MKKRSQNMASGENEDDASLKKAKSENSNRVSSRSLRSSRTWSRLDYPVEEPSLSELPSCLAASILSYQMDNVKFSNEFSECVLVWSIFEKTALLIRRFLHPNCKAKHVNVNAMTRRLALCTATANSIRPNGKVLVYDVISKDLQWFLDVPHSEGRIETVGFTPSGDRLLVHIFLPERGVQARMFDLTTHQQLFAIDNVSKTAEVGDQFVFASHPDHRLVQYDGITGAVLHTWTNDCVRWIKLSPDGSVLAVSTRNYPPNRSTESTTMEFNGISFQIAPPGPTSAITSLCTVTHEVISTTEILNPVENIFVTPTQVLMFDNGGQYYLVDVKAGTKELQTEDWIRNVCCSLHGPERSEIFVRERPVVGEALKIVVRASDSKEILYELSSLEFMPDQFWIYGVHCSSIYSVQPVVLL